MSLRLRLTLLVAGIMSLLIAFASVARYFAAGGDVHLEVQSNLQLAFDLLPTHGEPGIRATPAALVASLAGIRHVRVEYYDAAGRLRHASRDGDARAMPAATSWLRPTEWPAPLVKPFGDDGAPEGHFRVVPDARDELQEIWQSFKLDAALIACFAIALSALVFWAVSRALSPVNGIRQALVALERGQLDTRLAPLPAGQFADVTDSFNRTSAALQAAVQERDALLDKLLTMEEASRRSFAHHLHDELSPYLVAVRPHLAILDNLSRSDPSLASLRPTVATVGEHLDAMMGKVRDILETLHPPELQSLGLRSALSELVRQRLGSGHGQVAIALAIDEDLDHLSDTIDTSIYRIVQECITNAFKHSHCSRIDVAVAGGSNNGRPEVQVTVANDGAAVDQGFPKSGFGVLGIRERAIALGGAASAGPAPGGGWCVRVGIPVPQPA